MPPIPAHDPLIVHVTLISQNHFFHIFICVLVREREREIEKWII